jgi:hypothetical protein
MDKKLKGSWLIHHTNKLQRVESQAGFERVFLAGKAGILLSAISGDAASDLSNTKVAALAEAANINTVFELPHLLTTLKENQLIDTSSNGVAVLGVTTASALQHTSDIFDRSQPSASEIASLELSETASTAPISSKEATEQLSDIHKLDSKQVAKMLNDAEQIGFVDVEKIDTSNKLLFNGNLFRRDASEKIKKILDTLTPAERRSLQEVNSLLQTRACIEVGEVKKVLGEALFSKIMSVGLFDLNVVSNSKEATGFVTLPSAFCKYSTSIEDDAFDLAKAFVSSITYGMTKSASSRGRITRVRALLKTLVQGEPIGPVPAIAEDYRILELKGVVRVQHGSKGGRSGPMMTLLKREVGELALQVINDGDISEHSLDALPSAAVTKFKGPEENRVRNRRKQVETDPTTTNNILRVLRTGGGF